VAVTVGDELHELVRAREEAALLRLKVCLGGQAGDEIFGGYARYALAHPLEAVATMLAPRVSMRPAGDGAPARVGGNLIKQLVDPKNLRRIVHDLWAVRGWRQWYFQNFAKIPERSWRQLLDGRMVSRAHAYQIYSETLDRTPAADPADKLQHWDMQTYLTGLFQQDDRMSMAHSLESRVPLADPRLVRFAFHTPFSLKMRDGATKWILRQAVADVIPASVLNRRKAGFDTPAERWMRGRHAGFVRELLLSRRARTRGFYQVSAVEKLLDEPGRPLWFDRVWKLVCIEAWARTFLDGDGMGAAAP
jgi:asparagine synthase (glutamine-hydrolysing)